MQPFQVFHPFDLGDELIAEVQGVVRLLRNSAQPVPFVAEPFGPDFDPLQVGCVVVRPDAAAPQPWRLIERLALRNSALVTVALLEKPTTALIVEAMRHGAYDVIDWPQEKDRLKGVLENSQSASLKRHRPATAARIAYLQYESLTAGEQQTLSLIMDNQRRSYTISNILNLSMHTVANRRKSIFAKLGTRKWSEIAEIIRKAEIYARNEAAAKKPTT